MPRKPSSDRAAPSDRLVTISVEIPSDKAEELRDFAAGLRGEHPVAIAVFHGRPPSEVRADLKRYGLRYVDNVWQGPVPPSKLPYLRAAVAQAGGTVRAGSAPVRPVVVSSPLQMGIHRSRFDDLRAYSPYSLPDARKAVQRLFWRYHRMSEPASKLAKAANARLRGHWIKSNKPKLLLPKKALLVVALRELGLIDLSVNASAFTTSEATRFFDELGYETVIVSPNSE